MNLSSVTQVSHLLSRRFLALILAAAFAWSPSSSRADEAKPYQRISEEAFKARLAFFDYDKTIPLEGRVVRQSQEKNSLRQKIVFRGAQGFLVPGQIEFPKSGSKPFPLVLLLHGWSGSKEDWWKDDNYVYGGLTRKALLEAGYAVLALDAATHGERCHEIDFQHVNNFDDPKAPARRNYFTYAEIAIQTAKEYIKGPKTKLIWYESGHKLPPGYIQDAMAWLKEHL